MNYHSSNDSPKSIRDILDYSVMLIGIPYQWHRADNHIECDNKFWASNEPAPNALDIQQNPAKSIVCTGLINLMRRYAGLNVPGLVGEVGEIGREFPGTTGIWFEYLRSCDRLEEYDPRKQYPRGTLLLRNFANVEEDQGHVAVLFTDNTECSLYEYIIHSFAKLSYAESIGKSPRKIGGVGLTQLLHSHYWHLTAEEQENIMRRDNTPCYIPERGYYTHVCLPENWLMRN